MAIDLLSIKPNVVSKDLTKYILYIYGPGGIGKSYFASQMDKSIIFAFELGCEAIQGAMYQPLFSWLEFKSAVRDLKRQEVKAAYRTIAIDTIDIAINLCEQYICNQNNVEKISQIPYGNGYKFTKQEFEETFRSINNMGYGLMFISHAKDKMFKREDGTEYNQIIPTLAPSYNEVIRDMAYIQGYAHSIRNYETGETKRVLTVRSPDDSIECKSRFRYISPEITFTYEDVCNALNEAIDKEAAACGQKANNDTTRIENKNTYDYDSLIEEFHDLTTQLMSTDSNNAKNITEITDRYLGKGHKVVDTTKEQAEFIYYINEDLKDLLE